MDSPITSTPTVGTAHLETKEQNRQSQATYRPSYSPKNAAKWKGVFDKMIASKEDQSIPERTAGLRVNTLYIQCQDALRWLALESPDLGERNKYAIFKSGVSITRGDGCITIYFKRVVSDYLSFATIHVASIPSPVGAGLWKDEFELWLSTAQPGEIWEREGVVITGEQHQWLVALMGGLGEGTEVEVGSRKVRVMR